MQSAGCRVAAAFTAIGLPDSGNCSWIWGVTPGPATVRSMSKASGSNRLLIPRRNSMFRSSRQITSDSNAPPSRAWAEMPLNSVRAGSNITLTFSTRVSSRLTRDEAEAVISTAGICRVATSSAATFLTPSGNDRLTPTTEVCGILNCALPSDRPATFVTSIRSRRSPGGATGRDGSSNP